MNLLVTAGNTKVLIDRVRCITNIFTGRTGAAIALHAHERGHDVTLLTSRPEAVAEMQHNGGFARPGHMPPRDSASDSAKPNAGDVAGARPGAVRVTTA